MTEIHSYAPRNGTRDDFLRHAYDVYDRLGIDNEIYEWTIHVVASKQSGEINE